MQIVMDVKDYGKEHGSLLLAGEEPEETIVDRFTPEAIWACTTCYACVDACPVHIEHVPKLTDTRRHLVMESSEFPEELQNLFNNLERNSNPWGMGAHTRADWAEGLDLKIGEPAEYLFYIHQSHLPQNYCSLFGRPSGPIIFYQNDPSAYHAAP